MHRTFLSTLVVALVPTLIIGSPAGAQSEPPRPVVGDSPEAVAASILLYESLQRYAEAPTLLDSLTISIADETVEASIAFDEKGNTAITMAGIDVTVLDERIYVVMSGIEDRYLDVPIETDLPTTWENVFGPSSNQPFYFAARSDEPDLSAVLTGLGMGLLERPQIVGHREAEDDEGNAQHVVVVDGSNGEMLVRIDAESMLIHSASVLAEAPGDMNEPMVSAQATMNPVVNDQLEQPITFDAADRTAVSSTRELLAMRAEVTHEH